MLIGREPPVTPKNSEAHEGDLPILFGSSAWRCTKAAELLDSLFQVKEALPLSGTNGFPEA